MPEFTFPNIDTSYWKIKDKAWMKTRHQKWATIEPRLGFDLEKNKQAIDILKRYFLKGVMPDFSKPRGNYFSSGHLDLFCFIWLHPSRDTALLKSLRDQYVNSPLIQQEEVENNYYNFGLIATVRPFLATAINSQGKELLKTGENELLFNILVGDLEYRDIPEKRDAGWSFDKFGADGYATLYYIYRLLNIEKVYPFQDDILYQYDSYLKYWYRAVIDGRSSNVTIRRDIEGYEQILYAICHFDIEKEGDTCRSRIVQKFKQLFDEKPFHEEFERIWQDVKSGKIIKRRTWLDND